MIMKRILTIALTLLLAAGYIASAQDSAQTYVPTPVTVSKEKVKLGGKVYLSHVVLERQTLFSLARAYGVGIEEIYAANPGLRETGLQKNAIVLIPYKGSVQEPATVVQQSAQESGSSSFIEHTVRWYEDLDDISRHYNIQVRDIMEANGLKSRKISTRQVLRIPVKPLSGSPVDEPAPETPEPEEEPAAEVPDTTAAPVQDTLVWSGRNWVNFALVLPLQGSKGGDLNMDFYSGVLMAVREQEASGLKIRLSVHDLSNTMPPIESLVQEDFVLGPIVPREVEAILQRVDGRVPLISPLDPKASSLSAFYRNFIQVPSQGEVQFDELAAWVKADCREGDKVLLVTEKGAANVSAQVMLRSALAREEIPYDILSYAILEGRGIPAVLQEMMVTPGVNRVIVASESEAFVGDVVRNLGIMQGKGLDLVMYAPAKLRSFDTIDGSAFHQAQLHICTSYHADYSSDKVDRFVRAYRSLFRTEPSQAAFHGYDTACFFIQSVSRWGNAWTALLERGRYSGLQTDFRFVSDANGNFQNMAVRKVVFKKDYSTVLQ